MGELSLKDVDAFIYDADGTLLDYGEDPSMGKLGLHNESRLRATLKIASLMELNGLAELSTDAHASAFRRSAVHSSEGAFHTLLVDAGIFDEDVPFNPDDPLIRKLETEKRKIYCEMLPKEAKEVPGALSFIAGAHARGFAGRQAIASTGKYDDLRIFTHAKGFSQYIPDHYIAASEDVVRLKPEPDVFLLAAEWLGVPLSKAHRVAVFEDDPRGIHGANKAGFMTLAVTTIYTERQLLSLPNDSRPDHTAPDFITYAQRFGMA
jgi:beta-phosphoglucomutase-like phosphatase (HAD superfamily)